LPACPGGDPARPSPFETLRDSYLESGTGRFARYRAFIWEDGALLPVPDPDCAQPILGFESQREQVLRNTRALVEGRQVNNVLLYGESGTGKSLTVKSLLAVPEFRNLRLIEVDKDRLARPAPPHPDAHRPQAEVHPFHRRPHL
jgi:predicted AAA+ superfamily ATPase